MKQEEKTVAVTKIDIFDNGKKKLRVKGDVPFSFKIKHDGYYFTATCKIFSLISCIADTKDELIQDVHSHIVLLWDEYALSDDSELSGGAKELKKRLLEFFEEIE